MRYTLTFCQRMQLASAITASEHPVHQAMTYGQMSQGSRLIRDAMQSMPADLPEVSWDGTRFRILTDDSSSD